MNRNRLNRIKYLLVQPAPRKESYHIAMLFIASGVPFTLDWLPLPSNPNVLWPVAAMAILISMWALISVVVIALLIREEAEYAIIAKRLGVSYQVHDTLTALDSNPWRGFVQLAGSLAVVACVVAVSCSSVTYSLIQHFNWSGPFGTLPAAHEVVVYFLDQALKGVVFDFLEVFDLSLPNRLRVTPTFAAPFLYLIVVYRLTMALLTLQILWLAFTYWRAQADDEVTLAARHHAVQVGMRFQQEQRERRNEQRGGGWLPKWQWREYQELKQQKEDEGWLEPDEWEKYQKLRRKKEGNRRWRR